ncbi:hypothetical protein NLJ89_g1357 [Agrocybe chaxingu]|uniref:Uncharacterized protein n=1 Tax=Agrocybe chaxingu TaxID=84603 RepID=A0A9W8N064_9AGAR|nr:hypothetical protein NLJ89_g1357 [Agrocybe chaxingu]
MFVNNPYAQAGWHNPQNPHSINNAPWRPNPWHPPTFGALPPPEDRPASVLSFEFAPLNPDIFNCIVTGPNHTKFFDITTASGRTHIRKASEDFARIDWVQHPTVEARGVLARQRAGDFLKLTSDQNHRTMTISGRTYVWIPCETGIYLYSAGPNPPAQFARLTLSRDNTKVVLEITSEAFGVGLFEPSVISTVLLFSARNID